MDPSVEPDAQDPFEATPLRGSRKATRTIHDPIEGRAQFRDTLVGHFQAPHPGRKPGHALTRAKCRPAGHAGALLSIVERRGTTRESTAWLPWPLIARWNPPERRRALARRDQGVQGLDQGLLQPRDPRAARRGRRGSGRRRDRESRGQEPQRRQGREAREGQRGAAPLDGAHEPRGRPRGAERQPRPAADLGPRRGPGPVARAGPGRAATQGRAARSGPQSTQSAASVTSSRVSSASCSRPAARCPR